MTNPPRKSARERTLAHMQRMFAVAATTGALACNKQGANETTHAKPNAPAPETGTPTPSNFDPAKSFPTVDAVPTPACVGAASTIAATGVWRKTSSGALAVEVRLAKPTRPDVSFSMKWPPAVASGTTILSTTSNGADLVITFLPDMTSGILFLSVAPSRVRRGTKRCACSSTSRRGERGRAPMLRRTRR